MGETGPGAAPGRVGASSTPIFLCTSATKPRLMATPLFESGAPDVLYIVDLSGYVFRAYHAIAPLSSPSGGTDAGRVRDGEHARAAGAAEAARRCSRSRWIRPSRRSARRSTRSTRRTGRRPRTDLAQQMRRCRGSSRRSRSRVFQKDGFEADDLLIASAVAQARAHQWRVVIVSADKDMMQLVGDDVLMWDTMRDKVFGPPEVEERFGLKIAQVRDWLALTGDASDNVPGVPSVGPKTATGLLLQYGDLDGIYANLDKIEKKGVREKLREHEDAARLSQHLVTLRADVPCEFDTNALRYGGRGCPRRSVERLHARASDSQKQLTGCSEIEAPEPTLPIPVGATASTAEQATSVGGGRSERRGATAVTPSGEATTAALPARTVADAAELQQVAKALRHGGRLSIAVETDSPSPVRGGIVGLGLSGGADAAFYVPIGHRYVGAPPQLGMDAVRASLGPLFADRTLEKATHDAKLLRVALARAGMALDGVVFDTMLASYLLDPERAHDLTEMAATELQAKVAPAASIVPKTKGREAGFEEAQVEEATTLVAGRADAVRRLWERSAGKLAEERLTNVLEEIELPLSELLASMEATGVLVDTERLRTLGRRVEKELEALELEAHRIAGRVFNVHSPRQLEALLFDELKLKHVRRTKTSRSTDADTLETLAEQHPLPKVILEIRQLAKLKGTYIDTLPTLMNPETKRIHTRWEQAVAATGRLSSSDPNLQNIPIRTDLGREIRSAFVAPPGCQLVSADYSQIELRVLAHLSRDPVLVDAFRSGQDVHTRTAIEVFGVTAEGVTSELRRRAKAVNFGVIYGQGDSGLAKKSRDSAGGSRVVHRGLLPALRRRPALHERRPRDGARRRLHSDAVRPTTDGRGDPEREPGASPGRGTHRDEHAHPGYGRGPPEAGDARVSGSRRHQGLAWSSRFTTSSFSRSRRPRWSGRWM